MIDTAHLINMKCFKDLKIALRPLTVLTGFNAAGKSTALQSVLLISQATHTLCVEGVIPLNGDFTRLGSPGEVIGDFGSKSMSIELRTEDERCRWSLQAVTGALERLEIVEVEGSKGDVEFAPGSQKLWPSELQNGSLWNALKKVLFISAVRRGPNDIYLVPDDIDLERGNVGVEGQFAPWWYARCVDDEIPVERLHPHEAASSLRKQLDAYMSEIFPGSGANAEHVAKGSATRLEMRTSISSGWHRPSNVGYGLSYLFPIFVALRL